MSSFHEMLIRENRELLDRMGPHPLAVQALAGSLPEERFGHWLGQNFLWFDELERILVQLVARAPREIRRPLLERLLAYHTAQGAYRKMLKQEGCDPIGWRLDFAGHAYVSFLIATVHVGSIEESVVSHYASHLAYLRNWQAAIRTSDGWGPHGRFLEQFDQPAYDEWIDELAGYVDSLALAASAQTLDRMRDSFRMSLAYQVRWWDESLEGITW